MLPEHVSMEARMLLSGSERLRPCRTKIHLLDATSGLNMMQAEFTLTGTQKFVSNSSFLNPLL
jgi:hypothetical protein